MKHVGKSYVKYIWDSSGTLISKSEVKLWDIDIKNLTVSHLKHTGCIHFRRDVHMQRACEYYYPGNFRIHYNDISVRFCPDYFTLGPSFWERVLFRIRRMRKTLLRIMRRRKFGGRRSVWHELDSSLPLSLSFRSTFEGSILISTLAAARSLSFSCRPTCPCPSSPTEPRWREGGTRQARKAAMLS